MLNRTVAEGSTAWEAPAPAESARAPSESLCPACAGVALAVLTAADDANAAPRTNKRETPCLRCRRRSEASGRNGRNVLSFIRELRRSAKGFPLDVPRAAARTRETNGRQQNAPLEG